MRREILFLVLGVANLRQRCGGGGRGGGGDEGEEFKSEESQCGVVNPGANE